MMGTKLRQLELRLQKDNRIWENLPADVQERAGDLLRHLLLAVITAESKENRHDAGEDQGDALTT